MQTGIALAVLVSLCVGALAGLWLQRLVPQEHRSSESKDIVMVGIGAVSMLAGVVLGLVIADVTTSFDAKVANIEQFSSNLIELDRSLIDYGPKADVARTALSVTPN